MKGMMILTAAAIVFLTARPSGAFVQPTLSIETATPSRQAESLRASPYSPASQSTETPDVSISDPPDGTIPVVPEPSTALLVGLGLVGFDTIRVWRRRKA